MTTYKVSWYFRDHLTFDIVEAASVEDAVAMVKATYGRRFYSLARVEYWPSEYPVKHSENNT